MRLQGGVLDALRAEGARVDEVGLGEARLDVADLAVHLGGEVRVVRPRRGVLARPVAGIVDPRRIGREGLSGSRSAGRTS